jgi:hypothetical protein
MVSPLRLGCRSVPYIRNRCQHSAGRNRADRRIRPCRMAEHKGKTDKVHRFLVSVQVVCQGFGTNISRDILLPTQQSHQKSCADPRHSVLDHSHSRNLRRRAFRARCHAHDQSKKHNYNKQRIAVAKVVKINPKATPTDVRRALHHLSPSGKIKARNLQSVRSISTLL